MKIKLIYIENGNISITKEELEQLLEESYQDGIAEGRKSGPYYSISQESINEPYHYYSIYCDAKPVANNLTTVTSIIKSNADKISTSTSNEDLKRK